MKKIDKPEISQSVFADVEEVLFWIMAAELALYGLSAFTLFALAKLIEGAGSRAKEQEADEWPDGLEIVEKRSPTRRENFTKKKETGKKHASFDSEGLKRLRDALRDISFRLHGFSFKSYVRGDAVWVLMMKANQGIQETVAGAKAKLSILDDAARMATDAFRERLEKFLRKGGFEI